MADELTTDISISFESTSGVSDAMDLAVSLKMDYSTDQLRHSTQEVTTTSTELNYEGASTIGNGWWWFKNLDAESEIQIAPGEGLSSAILLRPGEVAGFRSNGLLFFYVKTTSGTATLEYWLAGGEV